MGVGYEVMGLMKTLLMGPILPAMLCRLSCCIRLHTTYNTDATTPNVAAQECWELSRPFARSFTSLTHVQAAVSKRSYLVWAFGTWNRCLSKIPFILLATRQCPHNILRTISCSSFHKNIESAYSISIHVIPKLNTLSSWISC